MNTPLQVMSATQKEAPTHTDTDGESIDESDGGSSSYELQSPDTETKYDYKAIKKITQLLPAFDSKATPDEKVFELLPSGFALEELCGNPDLEKSQKAVALAKADTSDRVYRVYCDGVFDLFHLGHMKMLEQAKKVLGAHRTCLIVGVSSDAQVHKFKGKTVMTEEVRYASVAHCRWVNEVIEEPPWVLNDDFLAEHRIDFVAHDAQPYVDTSGASASGDCYSHVKEKGMFLETQRTCGLSTSDIITNLVRDYDDYVRRNLKRGYTRQELNVGRTWRMRATAHDLEKKVRGRANDAKERVRKSAEGTRGAIRGTRDAVAKRLRYMRGKEPKPAPEEGIIHHTKGLIKAIFVLLWTLLTCCCWCRGLNKQQKVD